MQCMSSRETNENVKKDCEILCTFFWHLFGPAKPSRFYKEKCFRVSASGPLNIFSSLRNQHFAGKKKFGL